MPNIAASEAQALRRWAAEAMRLITPKGIFKLSHTQGVVADNKVKICDNFKGIECVKVNGIIVPHEKNSPCAPTKQIGFSPCGCSVNSPSLIGQCSSEMFRYSFFVKGCFIKFTHNVPDGTVVDIEYWELNTDEDGYVMIFEEAVIAIQKYIEWQLLSKYNKQSQFIAEKRWKELCLIVRGEMNQKTNEELIEMGLLWLPHKLTATRW